MRDLIARIKRDLDVREVASAYTEVFPSGPDRQRCRCLCGQNSDRDPSVMLWGDHWHCFACGLHGSAIDLVMLVERCDFRTAVDIIRRRWLVGEDVPLTRPFRPFLPSPDKSPSPEVLAALAAAQAFYAERLGAFTNRGNLPPSDAASEGESMEGGRRQCCRPPRAFCPYP